MSYSFEGRDANDTARMLGRYLHDNLGQDAAISFIGHSLGCRVTLETIKRLDLFRRRARQVCLMAPAVDDDSLSGPAEYLAEVRNVDRVAVMSSRKDTVLKYAYPAGDLLQAFVFASETADMALGFHGPRAHRQSGTGVPGNVFDLRIPVDRGAGHGDYVPGSPANEKQRTAAAFADDVISGNAAPRYAF
ncbi:MAG: alpha/beta hydrolase [Woeseiaceae bacterium]|nr:alpha/beta hydrolase [Woeseiaceae bacterium]